MSSLYNLEIESGAISALLHYGSEIWGDFYLIKESDWSKTNRPIFALIKRQLDATPPASVAPLVLAEMAKGFNISLEGVEIFDYLSGLLLRSVRKDDSAAIAKELKRFSVRRELVEKIDEAKTELISRPNASFDDMSALVEKNLTSINTSYYKGDEFANIFQNIVEVTEKRGANPINAEEFGLIGPFPTINQQLGSLSTNGDGGIFCCIGARTGNAKSAFGFYYNLFLAEKYQLPVLLLDVGEMSMERIQRRAICCLSEGKIPLWAVASGEWTKNKEWTALVRQSIWPRVKKIQIDYINVGNMSPREKISTIRRYYYNKCGRSRHLLILDDYLKGIEALGRNNSEYQAVGYYVNDIKSLISNEIKASFWTSVQNNRTGVYQGKKVQDIVDSEDQMGLSDRIIQQSDWGFILRGKVVEEISSEKGMFGNMRLTPVKTRELMGRQYERALKPIKLANGRFVNNYYSLDNHGFFFTEKGDLNQMLDILGQAPVPVNTAAPNSNGL